MEKNKWLDEPVCGNFQSLKFSIKLNNGNKLTLNPRKKEGAAKRQPP